MAKSLFELETLDGVQLQPGTTPKNKYERKPKKLRTLGLGLTAYYGGETYKAEARRKQYQENLDTIASGDLEAIAARGAWLSSEILNSWTANPNIYAQMLEELREAYTFFAFGTMPAAVS